jgi:hypothetical protein
MREAPFFLAASATERNFEHVTFARRREHFRGFWNFFWLLNSLQKRYFSTQEFTRFLSTVSSQRRVTRKETSLVIVILMLRVLTYVCFLWTVLELNWCVAILIKIAFFFSKDWTSTRFDLTKGLLFNTFFIIVWYQLCCCNHWVLEFESFTPPTN